MSADLMAALVWHPEGTPHLEYGTATLDAGGRPVREEGQATRWDYAAELMVAWCGCGWVGEPHPQSRADGRAEWSRLHRPVLNAMEAERNDHLHQMLPTLGIYEARVRLEAAKKGLTEAVGDSRRRGASWADVGEATALGKKVAHARWGKGRDVLLPRELNKGGRPRKPLPTDDAENLVTEDTAESDGEAAVEATSTSAPPPGSAGGTARRGPQNGVQAGAGRRGRSGRGRDTGRQVRELVRTLSLRHGLEVEANWEGTRSRDGRSGGWTVEWHGGPTRADMRADAELVIDEDPRLAGLDVRELRWWVSRTDADQAALVLEWLRTHPGEGDRVRHLDEGELPGWPEHLPAELRVHGATLAAAGWGYQRAGAAADALHEHAARGGYDAVASWLTELAAGQDADVVDLSARLARITVTER